MESEQQKSHPKNSSREAEKKRHRSILDTKISFRLFLCEMIIYHHEEGKKGAEASRNISSIWFYTGPKQREIGIPVASWLTRLTNDWINFWARTLRPRDGQAA